MKKDERKHQFNHEEMDKMQSKQHTLREETLTRNTLNCMVCLKKHPIKKNFYHHAYKENIESLVNFALNKYQSPR